MWFPEWLYTIDVLFAVVVLFFGIGGLRRGLSGELARALALIGLLAGFCFFYPEMVQLASERWKETPDWAVKTASAAALLAAALLLYFLAQVLLKLILKSRMDEATDKLMGATAGLLRGTLTGLAVMTALSLVPNEAVYRTLSEKSAVGAWVCRTVTPYLYPRIMELPVIKSLGALPEDSAD